MLEVDVVTEFSWIDHDHAYAIAITSVQLATALEYGPTSEVEVEKEVMRTELEIETQKFLEE